MYRFRYLYRELIESRAFISGLPLQEHTLFIVIRACQMRRWSSPYPVVTLVLLLSVAGKKHEHRRLDPHPPCPEGKREISLQSYNGNGAKEKPQPARIADRFAAPPWCWEDSELPSWALPGDNHWQHTRRRRFQFKDQLSLIFLFICCTWTPVILWSSLPSEM